MYNIYEAVDLLEVKDSAYFMTKEEALQKARLIKMLKEHRHAKYAKRLELYDLNIVEIDPKIGGDPNFTAAISTKKPIIYVSRGFLLDNSLFYQLDMLMRHELAHSLMYHEIRMIRKLGDRNYETLSESASYHDLLNVIMDDEISNKRYTMEDKRLCRNLVLNGKVISGLVTEDHRLDWQKLSLEEMYDKVTAELSKIRQDLLNKRAKGPKTIEIKTKDGYKKVIDPVENAVYSVLQYTDSTSPASFFGSEKTNPSKAIKNSSNYKLMKNSVSYTKRVLLIDELLNVLDQKNYSKKQLNAILTAICNSEIYSPLNFGTVKFSSPEDKWLANTIIKYYLGLVIEEVVTKVVRVFHSREYLDNYNDTLQNANDKDELSDEEIADILDALSDQGIIGNQTTYGEISEEKYDKLNGGKKK